MTEPALARRIEMTGWSTALLGVVCVLLAAMEAVMPILVGRFAQVFDNADDPTRAMREVFTAGAGIGAWINGLFGVALIVIGVAVSRRVRWAHAGLTIASWASIAVLAVLAKPTLAPFFAVVGRDAAVGQGLVAAGAVLLVAQVAAVLWFLRFWRRPDVRAAFR